MFWFAHAGEAFAECVSAPELAEFQTLAPADYEAGSTRRDGLGRVVAPVSVNGRGPFRFIVDTGANRSVLSRTLAEQLGLTPSGSSEVHSVHGVTVAPVVDVASLRYGSLSLVGAPMPILDGPMFSGEQGLLGVDGMRGRRLRMDFRRNCIEISDSRTSPRLAGWATVRGELRFGHLVLLEGRVNDLRVSMFVDTGSNTTMANLALRDRLRELTSVRTHRLDPVRAYTAGEPVVLDRAIALPRVLLGPIEARNVIAYIGDFHIFRVWELTDEPALLIGMDVLSQARAVAIDYGRATVHFRLQQQVRTGSRLPGRGGAGVTITN